MYIDGLVEAKVGTAEEALELINAGLEQQRIGEHVLSSARSVLGHPQEPHCALHRG